MKERRLMLGNLPLTIIYIFKLMLPQAFCNIFPKANISLFLTKLSPVLSFGKNGSNTVLISRVKPL